MRREDGSCGVVWERLEDFLPPRFLFLLLLLGLCYPPIFIYFNQRTIPSSVDLPSLRSLMLTEQCGAMSLGSDVCDLTFLPPAPSVPSLPGAVGGCGMSVGSGPWTQLLDLHPSSPYSSLNSHHSLIKREPSWGTPDPTEDPHCGAFTVHISSQLTGSGPCRVGPYGEPTASQTRMFASGAYLPGCVDSAPAPRNQGELLHDHFHFSLLSS